MLQKVHRRIVEAIVFAHTVIIALHAGDLPEKVGLYLPAIIVAYLIFFSQPFDFRNTVYGIFSLRLINLDVAQNVQLGDLAVKLLILGKICSAVQRVPQLRIQLLGEVYDLTDLIDRCFDIQIRLI